MSILTTEDSAQFAAQAVRIAVSDERERIVAWLRGVCVHNEQGCDCHVLADAIERGAHLKRREEGSV